MFCCNRFLSWIQNLGKEELTLTDPMTLYKDHSICNAHFSEISFSQVKRLKNNAVPEPCAPLSDDVMEEYRLKLSTWAGKISNTQKFVVKAWWF